MADAVAAGAAQNAAATGEGRQPAQTPVGEAALAKLPEKLQNLTRPVVVTGTVIGETQSGLTRIRTAAGEVQLQAPAPLPPDRPVTLQIPAGSPPPRAMVLAQPAASPQNAPSPNAPSPPVAGQSQQAPVSSTAAVAAPPPQASPVAGQTAPLQNAVQTLLQTTTAAGPAAAQLPAVGALISAVVLAVNPKPTAPVALPTAPGGQNAAPGKTDAGKADAAGGEAGGAAGIGDKGASGGGEAGGLRGLGPASGTRGQPVELGGDAAHRGTMLDPPPGGGKTGNAQGNGPRGGQPNTETPAAETPNAETPNAETPGGRDKTGKGQAGQGQAGQAPQGAPGASERQAPNGRTDGRPAAQGETPPGNDKTTAGAASAPRAGGSPPGPSVGLPIRDFGPPPPASSSPPSSSSSSSSPKNPTAQQTGAETPSSPAEQPRRAAAASGGTTPRETQSAETPMRAGQMLAFRVTAAQAPPAPGAASGGALPTGTPPAQTPAPGLVADPAADGATMEGTVAGATPQGRPILATRDGMLALNTDLKLPPGARLTLQLLDPAAPGPDRPAAAGAGGLPDYLQGRDWPALKAAMSALRDLDPALVQQMLATIMPQPNRKLGAALTFLISAMRGGDARGWLGGDAVRSLNDGGKENLLRGLEREFSAAERQTAEKLPDDWRGVVLPFFDQSGVNPLHLYVRPFKEPEQEEEKAGGAKGARFILDVELSRLGPLQLDGMVQPPQFNLILRSKAALPADLRGELRTVFADSLAAVGYGGGLTFQSDLRSWVRLARAGSAAPPVSA